jgi:hypothetical protein
VYLQAATNAGVEIEIGEAMEGDVEHATWEPPSHWSGGGRGDFSGSTAMLWIGSSRFSVAGECGRSKWHAWTDS